MATSFSPLEPEIQKSFGVSNPSSISGGLSSVFELLFSLSIISALVAGGLVILWAGALRLGGMGGSSSTNVSKSKDFFMRVFVVFIVVLPLTLFLRVINPDFLNTNVSLSGIKASLTKVQTDTFQGGGGSFSGGGSNGTSIPVKGSGSTVVGGADAEYRKRLLDAGIIIHFSNITFEGINPSTIDMLINLKNACRCEVGVTSAVRTDPKYANSNHWPGRGAVDLKTSDSLVSFIKQNGKVVTQGSCSNKWLWGGYVFWDEWDLVKNTKCSQYADARHFHVSFDGW